MTHRLLLCTDMDRTIIPNGRQPEHPQAREHFRQLCGLPLIKLVYVSGRHLQLVEQAIADYQLPKPDYAITDVGTKIFCREQAEWTELHACQKQIAGDCQGRSHDQLQHALSSFTELTLQEQSKQNDFKLSYYLSLAADQDKILQQVDQQLTQLGVAASLIWSIDEPQQVGLLDVLPRNATKLHGIEFLQLHLGYGPQEVIFAGDSGNDLPVLGSSIRSILVANAEPQIKQQALQLAEQNGNAESLFLAQQDNFPLGGNYSAGVLQGIAYYYPEIGEKLTES